MLSPKALVPGILFLLLGLVSVTTVYGAPALKLWPRWQSHDADSPVIVDHAVILLESTGLNIPV